MKRWLQRIRGTLGIGLTWAFGWAVGGVLIGVASNLFPGLPWWDAFFRVFDAPLPALAIPGFFAGVFFSTVVAVLGRRRRLNELSLARFAAWGAVAGVALTAFPFVLVSVGLASTEGSSVSALKSFSVVVGPFILFSAGSAALTLMLARKSARRSSRETDHVLDASLANEDSLALPGQSASFVGRNTVTGDPLARNADAGEPPRTRDIVGP